VGNNENAVHSGTNTSSAPIMQEALCFLLPSCCGTMFQNNRNNEHWAGACSGSHNTSATT